jgi:hypothetical protein
MTRSDIDGADEALVMLDFEVVSDGRRRVVEHDPEHCGLTSEYRERTGESDLSAKQVVVTMVHEHEPQAREQECQRESEARAVLEGAQQHREDRESEGETEARREYVQATALDGDEA